MIDNLDNKLNILFDHFSDLSLNEFRKIDQCQLRFETIFNFDTQNIFDEDSELESKLVIDSHQSRCFVH